MIRLNRTTEYGLMALKHMSRKRQAGTSQLDVTSAREIADSYGLPFEITAKTLQRLRDTGLIESAQGARGGYTLKRELEGVSLAEFL
jgi:DNA-binding IscR family transcriptional regulator